MPENSPYCAMDISRLKTDAEAAQGLFETPKLACPDFDPVLIAEP